MGKKYRYIRLLDIHNYDGWELIEVIPKKFEDEYNRGIMCYDNTPQVDVEQILKENERLKKEVIAKEEEYNDMLDQRNSVEYNLELLKQEKEVVKAEAYKEFAERLEPKLANNTDISAVGYQSVIDDIENLIKEMVGEDNGR